MKVIEQLTWTGKDAEKPAAIRGGFGDFSCRPPDRPPLSTKKKEVPRDQSYKVATYAIELSGWKIDICWVAVGNVWAAKPMV